MPHRGKVLASFSAPIRPNRRAPSAVGDGSSGSGNATGRRVPAVTGRIRRVANSATERVPIGRVRPRPDRCQPRDKQACRLLQLLPLRPPRVRRGLLCDQAGMTIRDVCLRGPQSNTCPNADGLFARSVTISRRVKDFIYISYSD